MEIREARINAELTQKEMSELTTIPRRTIEDWERGKSKPPKYVKFFVVDYLKRLKHIKKIKKIKIQKK